MTRDEFQKDRRAQRKAIVFGAALVIGLWWLFLPSPVSSGGTAGRRAFRQPAAPPPAVVRVPPVVQPSRAVEPFTKSVVGKWAGRETLPNRGQCVFGLELRGKEDETFTAFSTLACVTLQPTGNPKDPVGFLELMRRGTNPTSASFAGTSQDGAIVLHAVDNIGIAQALQGCEITAMSVRPFGDSALSVKWQEKQTLPVCQGGELVALRKPN